MIVYINYGILVWFYIIVPILLLFLGYRFIFKRKRGKKSLLLICIGISSLLWFGYENYSDDQNVEITSSVDVDSVEALSNRDIVETLLIKRFDQYKANKLLDKYSLIDYRINRIDDPVNGNKYNVSYSVKTISPYWLAGNGENTGIWVCNKSEYYQLLENNGRYELKFIGGL